jgi:hypothetical protein
MRQLLDLVQKHVPKPELERLLSALKVLDDELDQKIEDVRVAQQAVTVIDRINVFTNSDAELRLKEENKRYREIRDRHGDVVLQIKAMIRDAIYQDAGLRLKLHINEISKATAALRVERRMGFSTETRRYRVRGIPELRKEISQMEHEIDTQFNFPPQPVDVEELLHAVYDDILLKAGFIA